jgi:ATP-independent RNA helicase DbpA
MGEVLAELGYENPTEVQAATLAPLLAGRDLLARSRTGSGKTAAYGIPLLERLSGQETLRDRSCRALILCPTRELGAQIARELRRLGRRHAGLQVAVLCGGTPIYAQIQALSRGAHIVVGTPGRVCDHLRRETLRLDRIETLVLDEADRMLAMGFEEDLLRIRELLPARRQTALFSATYPSEIEKLTAALLRDPERVEIAETPARDANIRDVLHETTSDTKTTALVALLGGLQPESTIIFCNLKATVAALARELRALGADAAALHGDQEQRERDLVLARFRNRSLRLLVATDVAARGIDIDDLALAINYDVPSDPEVYVHRIGRTGRAGKTGLAVSLVTPADRRKIAAIEALIGRGIAVAPLAQAPASVADEGLRALEAPMRTLFVAAGRKDKLRPADLLGALTGPEVGLDASSIGKFELHDRLAYVAVEASLARETVRRLNYARIKGRRIHVALAR